MRYIYPPRPRGKIHPSDLAFYEKSGRWIAQRKFGGSRTMALLGSDGQVTFLNRHGFTQSSIKPNARIAESISALGLKRGKEHLLDGEMMRGEESFMVLYDILVLDGVYLFGKPNQLGRLEILSQICGVGCRSMFGSEVGSNLYLADWWGSDFEQRFCESKGADNIEGLLLRKSESFLDNFGAAEYETPSQIRCRKPLDSHYNF